jgi:hypothetical protein
MESFIYRLGNAITSLGAVIMVLLLTIIAGVCFSHTVFYESLPDGMQNWERSLASWAIACSWECTILVVVCNTDLLGDKRIPIVLSVCSGIVILFFIHAFDHSLTIQEYLKRWFIGLLVASINIVFSTLFYKKWCEYNHEEALAKQVTDLQADISARDSELVVVKTRLESVDSKLILASNYIAELEDFKKNEISRLICPYCGIKQDSVYKLAAHKSICGRNPKYEAKMSVHHDSELV